MTLQHEYEEAIRTRVCAACIERTGRGPCGMGQWTECTLNQFMPEVITLVNSIQSDTLYDYYAGLRVRICPSCKEAVDGICTVREVLTCPLDQYFPLIVESIRSVNDRHNYVPVS